MLYDGTTPTLVLNFSEDQNASLESAQEIIVTLATDYGKILFEKNLNSLTILSNDSLRFELTQDETFELGDYATILVQVNILYPDGNRACSDIVKTVWHKNLKREVMV